MSTASASRIRGQQSVPTEESPTQFKFRILTALGKLDDRDAQGRASDELKQVIDELTEEQLPVLLGCIHDAFAKAGSPQAKREHVRLFAVLCSVHSDAMTPHVSKIISVIIKLLKEGDTQLTEVCVDALALMSKSVPVTFISTEESPFPLALFIRPLSKLLSDQTKPPQLGAAMALSRVLQVNHRIVPSLLHHLVPSLLRWLASPHFLASAQLLGAMNHCIIGAHEAFLEYVPSLMELLLTNARSAQWPTRKAAFETLRVLAQCLGAAMNSYRDDVLRLLNELRYDKIRAVREAVGSAQQAYQELGSSLSPTKVPLQAEAEQRIRAHPSIPGRPRPQASPSPPSSSFSSHSSLPRASPAPHSPAPKVRPRGQPSSLSAPSSIGSAPPPSITSLPVQASAAPGVSLAELTRTVQAMAAQQVAFMEEVRGRLDRLEKRVGDIEAALGNSNDNNDNYNNNNNGDDEEDEEALVARIAELEQEEANEAQEANRRDELED